MHKSTLFELAIRIVTLNTNKNASEYSEAFLFVHVQPFPFEPLLIKNTAAIFEL